MYEPTIRMQRVADLILHELSFTLKKVAVDTRLQKVTFTAVNVTPDLKQAKIFFTVYSEKDTPSDHEIASVLEALQETKGFLRKSLSQSTALRCTPTLTFVYDKLSHSSQVLSDLIDEAVKRDEE